MLIAGCNAVADWNDLPGRQLDGERSEQLTVANVTASTLSAEHSCAIVGSGAEAVARCWGRNTVGQLGAGDIDDHLTPIRVIGLGGVVAVGTGLLHTCGVDQVGAVSCWGSNRYAALGRGTKDDVPHPKPERVAGISDATHVHCGMNFTCVQTKARTVACWGTNDFGQLGDGTTNTVQIPKPVAALEGVTSLSAGNQHACAVATGADGQNAVFCWGYNDHGQLGGTASTSAPRPTPAVVPDLAGAREVATGDAHTCAVVGERGTVKCWGANDVGQLGVPPSDDRSSAVDVPGLADVTSLGLGSKHTCAVSGGQMFCWGSNAHGQLGAAPDVVALDSTPRRVRSAGILEQIRHGYARGEHTCAVRPDGSLYCWGLNAEGQLGNGTRNATSRPSAVHFLVDREADPTGAQ